MLLLAARVLKGATGIATPFLWSAEAHNQLKQPLLFTLRVTANNPWR